MKFIASRVAHKQNPCWNSSDARRPVRAVSLLSCNNYDVWKAYISYSRLSKLRYWLIEMVFRLASSLTAEHELPINLIECGSNHQGIGRFCWAVCVAAADNERNNLRASNTYNQ